MRRNPRDRALELIDLIYRCASTPSTWAEFVSELSAELGHAAVGLVLGSGWESRPDRLFKSGYELNRAYFELRERDPWAALYATGTVGEVVVHVEPRAEAVAKSSYYRDYLRPQGLGTGPLVTLLLERRDGKLEGSLSVLARADGPPIRQRELELLRALAPHIRRAREICLAMDRGRARQTGFTDVLDQLQIGVLLLDEKGTPVFANRSAGELLGVSDRDSGSTRLQQIRSAFARATGALRIAADGASSEVVLIRHPVDGAPLQLIVSELERGTSVLGYNVPNAVFLADPRRAAGNPLSVLRTLYRLTPAEAKLTFLLAAGRTLEEAATNLGVTRGTVKTRLKKVFDKTDTHRQGDLIRLVLSGPGQLRGGTGKPSK